MKANNEDSGPDEVDLHGLYTQEAIDRTEHEISTRQARGDRSVRVIVGKGIHSKDHVAHIKPAIEGLMRKYKLQAHLDPSNAGVLVVDLSGSGGAGFSKDAGGFTRDLAKQASGNEDQVSATFEVVQRKEQGSRAEGASALVRRAVTTFRSEIFVSSPKLTQLSLLVLDIHPLY